MYDLELFLGLAVDKSFEKALLQANPTLCALFLSGGDYLTDLSTQTGRYIGKPLPRFSLLHQIESLETHLLSLLKKLAPDYPFTENRPVLLTHIDDHPRP